MSEKIEKAIPLELRLDLLVDAELPEKDRRELLLSLDREPRKWRDLSIRFLERQVEKQSVRDVMAQTSIQPPTARPGEIANFRFMLFAHRYGRAIAAGLLVAAVSAVISIYAVNRATRSESLAGTVNVSIPGGLITDGSWSVPVPVANVQNVGAPFFPPENLPVGGSQAESRMRRSVVIQPDGSGNAVVIPVKTLPMKFY